MLQYTHTFTVLITLLLAASSCKKDEGADTSSDEVVSGVTDSSSETFAINESFDLSDLTAIQVSWEGDAAAQYTLTLARDTQCENVVQRHTGIQALQFTLDALVDGGTYYVCVESQSEGIGAAANSGLSFQVPRGTIIWSQVYGNNTGQDKMIDAIVQSDGSLILFGIGSNLINASSGDDLWIQHVDASGELITGSAWNKQYDGNGGKDQIYDVAQDADGNVYVAASGENIVNGTSDKDWWIKKFRDDGTEITVGWDKKIDSGNGRDTLFAITVDGSGSVFAAGYGEGLIGATQGDLWIKKFDSAGNEDTINWNISQDGNGHDDTVRGIFVDESGNVFITGQMREVLGANDMDGFVKKFDASGNEDTVNWNKTFDFGDNDILYDIKSTSDGEFIVVGYCTNAANPTSSADGCIKFYDSSGTELVAKNQYINLNDQRDRLYSAHQLSDGSIMIVGFTENPGSETTAYDMFLYEYSESSPSTSYQLILDGAAMNDACIKTVEIPGQSLLVLCDSQGRIDGSTHWDWYVFKIGL